MWELIAVCVLSFYCLVAYGFLMGIFYLLTRESLITDNKILLVYVIGVIIAPLTFPLVFGIMLAGLLTK